MKEIELKYEKVIPGMILILSLIKKNMLTNEEYVNKFESRYLTKCKASNSKAKINAWSYLNLHFMNVSV